jgi:disulfide bond formation protein DsbB
MSPDVHPLTASAAYRAGAFAFVLALAGILAAIAFERIGGYAPCELCLMQRWAYYAGIPALFAALALVAAGQLRWSALLLFTVALAFLANAGLGVYHAGVEWKFWPGPETCSGPLQPLASPAGGLLQSLESTRVIRCDDAPWRFLGLSFAGWNVVLSLVIFLAAFQGAVAAVRRSKVIHSL